MGAYLTYLTYFMHSGVIQFGMFVLIKLVMGFFVFIDIFIFIFSALQDKAVESRCLGRDNNPI